MSVPRRLLWQCRRGSLELDLVLRDFLCRHYVYLGPGERHAFERLLEQPDETLWAWINATPPGIEPALAAVLERLRA